MKINGPNRVGAVQSYKKVQDTHQHNVNGKKSKKDELVISSEAKELLETQGKTATDKIETLKKSVADGTYHVETRALVEKLLPFLK
ncbi:flagellar biosynthesis anti-sigma factor FlgM [Paenibacillus sp. YYML68]|uniref:flagellar biosynthesis anti-sigma factor FlgM n=1 Tax=Paenibacillus sp. YYML68 TaxID=2909250 RepID=UPI002492567F|nr:flagellar biosynthesis anti-sigma factor FlgM [Paenibacillus sp. YYML68]